MAEQGKLDIQAEKKLETVEEYQFEPIKGYPMLHWKGKRPFNTTQYYPAQLKESYGEELDGWMNKIFWGDNLQVMSHLLKDYRGKVDLIYIDPPFDSKVDYKKEVSLKGKKINNDHMVFEEKQYSDMWTNDDYLQFMYERIILIRELLSNKGSVYVHCDWHKSHYLRILMDEIFGQSNFRNEIIWKRGTVKGAKAVGNQYARNHDTILLYSKSDDYTYNRQYIPYTDEYINKRYTKDDNDGRGPYTDQAVGTRSEESLKELEEDNRILYTSSGKRRIKYYLSEAKGIAMDDTWIDISEVNSMASDNTKYPTQKPEELIQRIINSSSNVGDLVFDCFMGSGTTQAVAEKLSRKYIGADINLGAIETSIKRLVGINSNFELHNVNNYDVFRNPIQAKEILKQALEIQPLPNNTIYDGEKDGRMVKIMPVNRIATRADLNELISGFNIKSFEKKFESSPNKSVESILLVCMGHEPDLAASLQKEMHPYKLDVEVVDILRDKSNLEFKRDSEAEVVKEGDKLVIKEFYPMNLLQKLSLMKENVEDWKELTESVKIDFNYDGAVFEPQIVDVPEKDELVKGEYAIPEDAGTIRVKITDLLSESLELTIEL